MQTRFSYDKELVKKLSDFSANFSYSSVIMLIITAFYYLYGIIYTVDHPSNYNKDANIPCISFFVCTVLLGVLLFILFKFGYIKKSVDNKLRLTIGLIYDIPAFVSLYYYHDLPSSDNTFFNISITYLVVAFAVDILFVFIDGKRISHSKELISDLSKGYLELKDTCICGLCLFTDGFKGGKYFELSYSDIRDIRIIGTSVLEKQFFNLCIDHPTGTYKLSVELPAVARENILFACSELREGRTPFEKAQDNLETVEKETKSSMQFIYCTKCNTMQSSERKNCFRCGEPLF